VLSTYESCSAVVVWIDFLLWLVDLNFFIADILMGLLLRRYRNYSAVDVFTFCTYIGNIPILSDCVRCRVTYVTV